MQTGKFVQMPLNGDARMFLVASCVTAAEKTIWRACLSTASNTAGCQAMRQRIGHCCFGFRVVRGDVIFVAVSPDRRDSSVILKLSRARENDAPFEADDPVARWRNARLTKPCFKQRGLTFLF